MGERANKAPNKAPKRVDKTAAAEQRASVAVLIATVGTRAAVRLMLAAWQTLAQRRPRTAIVAASSLLRVSTALVLVAAERVLPTWDAEVTTLAKAHALSTRLEAFVRWDTVHYVQIALEGYERDQQTAFLPGLPALLRCGGQLVRRLKTGKWGGFTANDAVIAGIVATAIATTAAALALHR